MCILLTTPSFKPFQRLECLFSDYFYRVYYKQIFVSGTRYVQLKYFLSVVQIELWAFLLCFRHFLIVESSAIELKHQVQVVTVLGQKKFKNW